MINAHYLPIFLLLAGFFACKPSGDKTSIDHSMSKKERMIPIETEKGSFNVWTQQVGENPDVKVLLLHGGPGCTHEYFTCFKDFLPEAGYEMYFYDQLESAFSDQPNDPELWTLDRYVDEVEQVRTALGMDSTNFILLGHSWGGILAIEYALQYQQNLKGLVISNMMASIPAYNNYAHTVLGPQMDSTVLQQVLAFEAAEDYSNPEYMNLLTENYYTEHILRLPLDQWPEEVNNAFDNLSTDLYVHLQGPSEFGVAGDAVLKTWDRLSELNNIKTKTLCIGGRYDTMDPEHMRMMADSFPNGQIHICEQGSHMCFYDDQASYFKGLVSFLDAF